MRITILYSQLIPPPKFGTFVYSSQVLWLEECMKGKIGVCHYSALWNSTTRSAKVHSPRPVGGNDVRFRDFVEQFQVLV